VTDPQIYSPEYYQRIFELEGRHWWHLGMREIAAALLRSQPGGRIFVDVLDAGCGTGGGLTWLGETLHPGRLVGIDIAWEAVRIAWSRPGALLAQASLLLLPFPAQTFDLVLCQDVLQHLPTEDADARALAEMYRVLRPGGVLLLRANSRLGMWQRTDARDPDFQRYTLAEIVARVQAAGFVVRRATYANGLPALYASARRGLTLRFGLRSPDGRLYEGLPLRDTPARRIWLNRLLMWVLRVEARYLSSGRSLAFGHSTFCLGQKPEASGPR